MLIKELCGNPLYYLCWEKENLSMYVRREWGQICPGYYCSDYSALTLLGA